MNSFEPEAPRKQFGQDLYVILMGFLLVSYLFLIAAGSEIDDIPATIWILRCITVPMAFWYGKLWKDKGFWILCAYFAWFTLRLFIPDPASVFSLDASVNILAGLWVFASCYGLGRILDARGLKRFLGICAGIWAAGMTAIACITIYCAWTDTTIPSLKPWFYSVRGITMLSDYNAYFGFNYQNRMNTPYLATTGGGILCMSVLISLIVLICTKSKWNKVLHSIAILLITVAMALTDSRTAYATVSAACGVMAFTAFLMLYENRQRKKGLSARKKPWYIWAGALFAMLAVFAVLLFSVQKITPAFNELKLRGVIPRAFAEEAEQPVVVSTRGFSAGLNARDDIWKSAFEHMKANPSVFLIGQTKASPMNGISTYFAHVHCMPLMILVESGLPGILLIGAFLLMTCIRGFRVLRDESAPAWIRLLPALVVSILVGELVECYTWLRAIQIPIGPVLFILLGILNRHGLKKQKSAAENRRIKHVLPVLAVLLTILVPVVLSGAVEKPLKGTQVLLAGDSRSSADYTFYKELLEKKTGCTALAMGASGQNAAYNASDEYLALTSENDFDFSIWLIGGNDTGEEGTVGTFRADSALAAEGEPVVQETDISNDYDGSSFIQAVDHIMRKYALMNTGSRDSKAKKIMIFCTDLPQQRDSADSPWSNPQNWERKRLAILECCAKNNVVCLDLYSLCAFDMSQEPMYSEPTDTQNDRGIYYMDGLHPNRRGMERITDFEAEILKQIQ